MNQLYYRDLRKRVEALEAEFFPEPEPQVTVYWLGEDDLPDKIIVIGRGCWERRENEPIPPAVLRYATPEARAAYEAQARQATRRAPPQSEPLTKVTQQSNVSQRDRQIGDRKV